MIEARSSRRHLTYRLEFLLSEAEDAASVLEIDPNTGERLELIGITS